MPAVHLAPRFLEGASSGGISPTAIAVLIVVGVIPVIALIWICIWLLFTYSSGRNCCCMRRKTGSTTSVESVDSAETLNEKMNDPIQRPEAAWRSDGEESGNGRVASVPPTMLKKHAKRGSVQSRWSSGSGVVVQEPKSLV